MKFTNLSPFVDKKSIQVKVEGVEIQSVNFQKNYLKTGEKSSEQISLESKLTQSKKSIDLETIRLETVLENIQFLNTNKNIKGNQTLTASVLKEASNYYASKIKSLKTEELLIRNILKELKKEQKSIAKQLSDLTQKKHFASGEIFIKIKSNTTQKANFELMYNVSNVSWFPSYDIRVSDISSPLTLV